MLAAPVVAGAAYSVRRIGRRSGVTDAGFIANRAGVIAATPNQIRSRLQQLGKGRGGWYFTARNERFLIPDASQRGARVLLPQSNN